MNLLIETSTDLLILALFTKEGEIVSEKTCLHGNNLSKTLLPSIDALLVERGLRPKDLTGIACGIGPGSYTGMRVGVAVAKSLAFSLQIPLQGFSSLLAFLPASVDGQFLVCKSARSGAIFILPGVCSGGSIVSVDPHFFGTRPELLSLIQEKVCVCAKEEEMGFPCVASVLNLRALTPFLSVATDLDMGLLYLNHDLSLIKN